ncbi:MAG TPA: lysylphosphatidylglycerol synthase domain-containing protein [Crenalkalicoccus sp.]|nr:lysylphosphatidylglycerol synthase domain-containing protein [Crenalkalicoccus sp.]
MAPAQAARWRRGLRHAGVLLVLLLAVLLLLRAGEIEGLRQALRELPAGVAFSAAVHLVQLVLLALAWRELLPRERRPGIGGMVALRWYRESAAAVLPAGGILGQAAAARLLARWGVPPDIAAATATVDMTVEAAAQLGFTLAGLAVLVALSAGNATLAAVTGGALAVAMIAAMVAVQRNLPVGFVARILARFGLDAAPLHAFQATVLRLHARRGALGRAFTWHMIAWLLGAVEVAGVLQLLGQPVGLAHALVIESVGQALRNAGFLLPGAAAVQEGALVAAAALVGVPAGGSLAMALARRARELIFALPGLLAWRRAELRPAATP